MSPAASRSAARPRSRRPPEDCRVSDGGRGERHRVRAARAGAWTGSAPLPARHRTHASDPRPPGGARLADRRRSGLRQTVVVAGSERRARRVAASVSKAGVARVANRAHPSGYGRPATRRSANPRDLKGLLALPRCFMKAGVFVALAIAATLIACGGGSSNSANSPTTPSRSTSSSPAPQQSLTIVADSTTHEIGRSYLLTALLRVSGQPDKDVSKDAQWRSSNTSVATMQANTLTIRGLGEVDIAVDYQQLTGSYHLSISMGQVVFNVDSGVSSADQDLIRDAANLALSYFSSTFGWAPTQQITVKIVASGGLQDPGGSNVTAVTGGSTVTVYVNSPWWTIAPSTGTTFSKQTIIVSEFFHVLQYSIGWLVLGLQPDVLWLADGGAGYVASRATIIDRGLQSADQVRGCHQYAVDHSSPSIPALVQLEGQNFYVFNGQGAATYDIAYLATEQATQARGVGALMTFGLTASSGWQNAFQQAFGISVNDFYSSFEQYRRTWHAPADFACG